VGSDTKDLIRHVVAGMLLCSYEVCMDAILTISRLLTHFTVTNHVHADTEKFENLWPLVVVSLWCHDNH